MKEKLFTFGLLVFLVMSCTNIQKEEYPYNYVDSKIETIGVNYNKMDLFAYSGVINTDSLKLFCKQNKDEFSKSDGMFYFLVIFDTEENAVFPSNPFTAEYGMEEEPQKHIKAYYIYNRFNGYSRLECYEKNKWENVAISIHI